VPDDRRRIATQRAQLPSLAEADGIMADNRYPDDRVKLTGQTRKLPRATAAAVRSPKSDPRSAPETSLHRPSPRAGVIGRLELVRADAPHPNKAAPHTGSIPARPVPMNTLADSRPALEAEIGAEIVALVPHWYLAECGPEHYSISVGQHVVSFFNHRKLTPNLAAFLKRISSRTRQLPLEHFAQLPSLIDVFLESLAIEWLRIHHPTTDWTRLIKYLELIARRTHENKPVAMNIIIRPGQGTGDITQPYVQKVFDRLASSPYTFLALDPDLRLIEYGGVEWAQITDAPSYKFHPEFLHPIHCVMGPNDLSAHLTTEGDLIIMNKAGLLAARRKRKWKIYDVRTFKNSLSYCLGNFHVGANLFEVVFDLSFRRYGSLLIYDPEHCTRSHILNPESILFPGWRSDGGFNRDLRCGQALIGPSVKDLALGRDRGPLEKKRRLLEMACVDGALVFDDNHLLAVGAIIESHPGVGNQLGARTTATRSAYLWGAHPVKVSSDGDVTIYFKSRNGEAECDAVMQFL
jgi:hypothetical protein